MKRLLLLHLIFLLALSASAFTLCDSVPPVLKANKMYRVMNAKTVIRSSDSSDSSTPDEELLTVGRGDTLLAAPDTEKYLSAHAEEGYDMLPVEVGDIRGYCNASALIPIKAAPADSIYPIVNESPEEMAALEQSLVPWRIKAMNLPVGPSDWLWLIVISITVGALIMWGGFHFRIALYAAAVITPICLCVASVAEIGYLLASDSHALWFFSVKSVGWIFAILGFIAMSVVLTAQYMLFFMTIALWAEGFDRIGELFSSETERDDHSLSEKIFSCLAGVPVVVSIATILLVIVDSFTGNTWNLDFYKWVYAVLGAGTLIGAICLLFLRRPLLALLFIPFFVLATAGMSMSLSILGLYLLLYAVVALVLVSVFASLMDAVTPTGKPDRPRGCANGGNGGIGKSLNSTGNRVRFRTPDGRIIWGTRVLEHQHLVHGDDGKRYNLLE